MKFLVNILKDPFAIATTVVHALFWAYSLIFENTGVFSKTISMHRYALVYEWLLYINVVPFNIIEITGTILDKAIGMNFILSVLLIIFAVVIVNFQWLIIGYCISTLFSLFGEKERADILKL